MQAIHRAKWLLVACAVSLATFLAAEQFDFLRSDSPAAVMCAHELLPASPPQWL
jgi:hypothetical protein